MLEKIAIFLLVFVIAAFQAKAEEPESCSHFIPQDKLDSINHLENGTACFIDEKTDISMLKFKSLDATYDKSLGRNWIILVPEQGEARGVLLPADYINQVKLAPPQQDSDNDGATDNQQIDSNAKQSWWDQTKTVQICGVDLRVSAALYFVCYAVSSSLPASCTAGAAATAGTLCAAQVAAAAAACGMSSSKLWEVAKACMAKMTD